MILLICPSVLFFVGARLLSVAVKIASFDLTQKKNKEGTYDKEKEYGIIGRSSHHTNYHYATQCLLRSKMLDTGIFHSDRDAFSIRGS